MNRDMFNFSPLSACGATVYIQVEKTLICPSKPLTLEGWGYTGQAHLRGLKSLEPHAGGLPFGNAKGECWCSPTLPG
jgi:hypothetical protein